MTYTAHPALVAHSRIFERRLLEVGPGMWTAVGYAASNVHILEGDTGLVLIDSTESTSAARELLAAVRDITSKPVHTIIYTHGHRSHISGAAALCSRNDVSVIAGPGFAGDPLMWAERFDRKDTPAQARKMRAKRAYGADLPKSEQVSLGFGPAERAPAGFGSGYLPPTHIVQPHGMVYDEDGLRLLIRPTGAVTGDHVVVWRAETRTLFCGDLWCEAFPNLFSLRGTPYRDQEAWVKALDMMMDLRPETLCPGHTRPVSGTELVAEVLGDTRAAIAHVIAATSDGLNHGIPVGTLADQIRLPQHLAAKAHLTEAYGRVDWAVRAYANGQMGWFDGNPTKLAPLSPKEEARRFVDMAGGARIVLQEAEATDAPQWAMELCDRLIVLGELANEARALKSACLEILAENEINAQARNYYLSCAKELNL